MPRARVAGRDRRYNVELAKGVGGDARLGGDAVVGHLHENVAGEMSRVATHPRPVRGNFPMVTPCSRAAAAHPVGTRAPSRCARARGVRPARRRSRARCRRAAFWSCEASRAPGGRACASPSTSRQPDDATRTPDELGTSSDSRACARATRTSHLLGHAQDRKGKRRLFYDARTAFAFSGVRSIIGRRAPVPGAVAFSALEYLFNLCALLPLCAADDEPYEALFKTVGGEEIGGYGKSRSGNVDRKLLPKNEAVVHFGSMTVNNCPAG